MQLLCSSLTYMALLQADAGGEYGDLINRRQDRNEASADRGQAIFAFGSLRLMLSPPGRGRRIGLVDGLPDVSDGFARGHVSTSTL